jgi:hypothetical protein
MPFNIGGHIYDGTHASVGDYKNIIERGLVLHLDASALESYSGSGVDWYDMSGKNNHGTLINGPTFSSNNQGYINLDGSNDYITIPYSSNWSFGTGEFTIEVWVYIVSVATPYQGIIGTFPSKWPASNWIVMTSTSSNAIRLYTNDGVYEGGVSNSGIVNGWMHGVVTRISNTVTLYVNGSLVDSSDFTSKSVNNSSEPLLIGNAGGTYGNMRVSSVKVYKGIGFTSSMVTQNYNTQKSRFGL